MATKVIVPKNKPIVSRKPGSVSPAGKPGYWKGVRVDGWENLMTGIGVRGVDKRIAMEFKHTRVLDQETLRQMYRGDGFIRRVVDLPTQEMTRRGFEIVGDPDGFVNARMKETGIHKARREMIRWSRLFGGSLGVIGVDDGRDFELPLNEANIRTVSFMHVFHRWRVWFTTSDLYDDPKNPKFGQPQWYTVQPIQGNQFKVHESRTVRLDGLAVDDLSKWENQGWGDSVVQACFAQFRAMANCYAGAESVIDDFVQAVISINGLSALIESGQEDIIRKRVAMFDESKHSINTMLLDSQGETYTKHASSIAGLSDLLDKFVQACSAVSGIPVTLLMGESPGGLNSPGDSESRNFYDKIASDQVDELSEMDERLSRLIMLAKKGKFGGIEPEEWTLKYLPLWEPSDKEIADLDKLRADTAAVYITNSVLDPQEVRDSKSVEEFLGEAPEGDAPQPPDPAADPKEAAAAALAMKKTKTDSRRRRRG